MNQKQRRNKRTWQFGEAAKSATEIYRADKTNSPECAWKMAARQEIKACTSRKKPCPKGAYLGLCSKGLVRGVRPGNYTQSVEKPRAIKAIELLQRDRNLAANPNCLWKEVKRELDEKPNLRHNGQMHVVVALWENGYIASSLKTKK